MKHFEPCKTMDTEEMAAIWHDRIWTLHGFLVSVVSDRGAQFTSKFWKHLCGRLGVKVKLSTAHHSEMDGQTESVNGWLKQYLREFVNYAQDD
jgi:transposase InsO family protein